VLEAAGARRHLNNVIGASSEARGLVLERLALGLGRTQQRLRLAAAAAAASGRRRRRLTAAARGRRAAAAATRGRRRLAEPDDSEYEPAAPVVWRA